MTQISYLASFIANYSNDVHYEMAYHSYIISVLYKRHLLDFFIIISGSYMSDERDSVSQPCRASWLDNILTSYHMATGKSINVCPQDW